VTSVQFDLTGTLLSIVVGYLVGGIPFALIVGKLFYHCDPREHGSGNLGATNVLRVLGIRAGVAVFALDVAKGAAAVLATSLFVRPGMSSNARDLMMIAAALAAMLGHSYSPYIHFKGGKGVAVAAGALIVITPLACAVLFGSFLLVVALTRIVSLTSVLIACEYPVLCLLYYRDRPVIVAFAFFAAALVVWRHRANIGRIRRGEEAKIQLRRGGLRAESNDRGEGS